MTMWLPSYLGGEHETEKRKHLDKLTDKAAAAHPISTHQ